MPETSHSKDRDKLGGQPKNIMCAATEVGAAVFVFIMMNIRTGMSYKKDKLWSTATAAARNDLP